jgi:peptidoglycan/LPS O-acetylase OafA/YrhL
MIQRIQSVYLFLAALASGSQFALPYAKGSAPAVPALADGQINPFDNIGLLGLVSLGLAVSVAAIFVFKNRPLQMRIAGGATLVSALLLVLVGLVCKQSFDASSGALQVYAGLGLPLVSLILNWLAGRAIRKDEQKVRSMDRLR